MLQDKDHINTEFSQTNITHNLKDKSINFVPNKEIAPSSSCQLGTNTILMHEDNSTEGTYYILINIVISGYNFFFF